jgi:hypothetical protein
MAPDIYLERGRTYSFVVETGLGSDPDQTFHPVYITSDPTGGHQLKSDFEAKVSQAEIYLRYLKTVSNGFEVFFLNQQM